MKRIPLCLALCFMVSYTRKVWNTASESLCELSSFSWWNKWQLGYVPSRCFSCGGFVFFIHLFLFHLVLAVFIPDHSWFIYFYLSFRKYFFLLLLIRGLQYKQVFWNTDMNISISPSILVQKNSVVNLFRFSVPLWLCSYLKYHKQSLPSCLLACPVKDFGPNRETVDH